MPACIPNKLQEGAIGVEIVLRAVDQNSQPVDISAATLLEITVERSDGTGFTRTAVLDTDGEDGLFKIITEAGDLTPAGVGYAAQGRFAVGASLDVPTSILEFEVLENLA
jgi:hypothetical protein